MTLGPDSFDALREFATVGCGHAVSALSRLMGGRRVLIEVPTATVLTDAAAAATLEDVSVVVRLGMDGDMSGQFLVLHRKAEAEALAYALIGESNLDSSLVQSALNEVGNIAASSCFTAVGKFTGLHLMPSVPTFARRGEPSNPQAEIVGGESGSVLILDTRFTSPGAAIAGRILIVPDEASVPRLVRALQRNVRALAHT